MREGLINHPPTSINELLQRATSLSGFTLQEIATQFSIEQTYLHKGWSGQLLEIVLGATAHSKPEPDFVELGIELKTLPIDSRGKPIESTFVCAIPKIPDATWQGSCVQRKLATVLWMPILSETASFLERKVGTPLLWSPSVEEEKLLREDWEELTELIMLGKADELTARHGQVLQVRPKAAHSRILRADINHNAEETFIVPRGFYLRSTFTANIIAEHYLKIPTASDF